MHFFRYLNVFTIHSAWCFISINSYVTHISDELKPNKGVCYGQIGTYVRVQCIVYHKLCEIHHVFQSEYITKFITQFPVQFNYVKIMKYHYLYSLVYTYMHNW